MLGELLLAKGLITSDQLARAIVESRQTGVLLGQVLIAHGWVFDDELARTLADQWSLSYINLRAVGVDPDAASLLPCEVGSRVAAIPVRKRGDAVQVAFADPSDPEALEAVGAHIASVEHAVAPLSDIEHQWRSLTVAADAPS